MPIFQCNACKGTYSDTLGDGTTYMHVCGPLPPDKNGAQLERKNKRDENLATLRDGTPIGIRHEGAGVTAVSDPQLPEPKWITTINARIQLDEEG